MNKFDQIRSLDKKLKVMNIILDFEE